MTKTELFNIILLLMYREMITIAQIKACQRPKMISDLKDLINSNSKCFGDKVLYIYKEGKEEKKFTYNQVLNHTNAIGTAFSVLGIMGSTIAVIGDTHPEYMNTYYATVNGGGVIVPLDRELSADQIVSFCILAEVEAIAYTKSFNDILPELIDKIPNLKYMIPITPDKEYEDKRIVSLPKLLEIGNSELEAGNRSFIDHEVDLKKPCAILFTSGTTGTSKGVVLSQFNLAAATNSSCQTMEYDYRNRFVSVLPLHHTYETTCGHLAISNLGAQIYINQGLKNVLRSFAKYKPNSLMLVPLFVETVHKKIWIEVDKKGMRKKLRTLMKISDALLKIGIDLRPKLFGRITSAFGGNLRSIVCGGAAISPEIVKDFQSFGITVIEGYGITECAPLVAVNNPNNIRYHSVGKPVFGCEVKIDKEDGKETGEILARGDNVMMGYYKNDEANKDAFTEDGFFRTGDIGYMDDEGFIYITGRKKNVIVLSNGKNVFPEEIEEHLSRCDLIAESVVLGRNNDNGKIVITAVIYPNYELLQNKTADEVYSEIKEKVFEINRTLPSFKQVREIEIRTEEFEKTTSKKIKRFLVK